MSFTQKAHLAGQYMAIFNSHISIMLTLMAIIFVLAMIGIFVAHSDFTIYIIMTLFVISVIGLCCLVNLDQSQHDVKVNTDSKIARYSRQLPYYQRQASITYKQSLHLRGAKAYCTDHQYCHDHHKAELMKYYVRTHQPEKPWINKKLF